MFAVLLMHSGDGEWPSHGEIARQFSESSAKVNRALQRQKNGKAVERKDGSELKAELEMWEHKVSVEELLDKLESDRTSGLSSEEAKVRLERYGPNVLTPPRSTPWYVQLLLQFTNFFAILLQIASLLSFLGYILTPENKDNLYLGIVLYVVVIITAIFTFSQEFSSDKTMEKFNNFLPPQALAKRDGNLNKVDASTLVVGDIINVKLGDKVPADIRLITNEGMKVEMASLTGEPEPLGRTVDCTDDNPLETKNLAFFGTLCVEGTATGVVVNTADRTVFGRIAGLAAGSKKVKTTLQVEITHFVLLISALAIFLGIIFFIFGLLRGNGVIVTLVLAISIIVANVPEGLLATVTVALTLTAKQMARKNVLVKKLESVETLGSTTTICSDKTGTLTQNRMTVAHVMYDGTLHTAKTSTSESTVEENNLVFKNLFRGAACCAKAVFDAADMETCIDERKVNGDASEEGILKFAEKITSVMDFRARNPQVSGIPFNSTNKYMVTIHRDEEESGHFRMLMKGAPERVIDRCTFVLTGNGNLQEMTAEYRQIIDGHLATMMGNGERVLGFAQRLLPQTKFGPDYVFDNEQRDFFETITENQLCFTGLISLMDPPRESVPFAVQTCQEAGIQVIMVTGDHPATAKSIAKSVNILQDKTVEDIASERGVRPDEVDPSEAEAIVVPGWIIKDMEEQDWDRVLAKKQIVFARTSPQQKLIIVENCQRLGKIVAVTGDGVNDSPALRQANIGVAMGIAGSDVSKEAADMILLDDNFSSIVRGVEEGRLIFDNLKKSIAYTLSSNIPELIPFLLFIVAGFPLPLTTILIICVDVGTDMVPAISLAYEKKESDIMRRPPRNARTDRLVNRRLISFAYLQIGVIQALAGLFAYFIVMNDYGFSPSLLPGLDSESFFASKTTATQRWLIMTKSGPGTSSTDRVWFDRDTDVFASFFTDNPPANFTTQRTDLYSELPNTAGTLNGTAFDGLLGFPVNADFNNMIKIVGYATAQPPCLQYACVVNDVLIRNDDACFDPVQNPGPVYYDGINTGVVNTALTTPGCFDLSSVEQQQGTLNHAQTAYFVAIVVVQWSDLLICKTRTLSLFQQGLKNPVLLFGLFIETVFAVLLCYLPPINAAFGTAPILFLHWLPGLPFSLLELVYDETRKFLIRKGTKSNDSFKLGTFLRDYTRW